MVSPEQIWKTGCRTWLHHERAADPRNIALNVLSGRSHIVFGQPCRRCGALPWSYTGSDWRQHGGTIEWAGGAHRCEVVSVGWPNIGLFVALACKALCGE